MTKEEAINILKEIGTDLQISFESRQGKALIAAIENLEAVAELGKELRLVQQSLNDEALIGFNVAIAICNKYLKAVEE